VLEKYATEDLVGGVLFVTTWRKSGSYTASPMRKAATLTKEMA